MNDGPFGQYDRLAAQHEQEAAQALALTHAHEQESQRLLELTKLYEQKAARVAGHTESDE